MLFTEFLDNIYLPVCLPKLAASTQNRSRGVIANYLRPRFGEARIAAISVLDVDRFLTWLAARDLTHESLDKIRDVLSGVFSAAVRYGFLDRNPARGLRLPRAKLRRAHRAWITPAQLAEIVSRMAEPYATMVYTAAWTGLRVSELIGLRWRNVGPDSITVAERCCRGDWGEPKTEASAATIPVNRDVLRRLGKRGAPDALVFRTACGRPLRDNNVLVRHLKPAARQLGLGWVNWLVLRRSFASWLKIAGADVKDAQGLMRHARASTTLDVYQQFVPASQRRVIDSLLDHFAAESAP